MKTDIVLDTTKPDHHAIVKAVLTLTAEEQNSLPWQFAIISETRVVCPDGVLFDNLPIVGDVYIGTNLRIACVNSEICAYTLAETMHHKGLI